MTHAIRIHANGGPEVMKWESVPTPEPGPGEALIRHGAVGLNYIDVYFRTGLYKAEPPFIPGKEGAGTVTALGDGVTNRVPVSRALLTYSTTSGCRWPTSMAPNPIDRSSSWRPSTSVSHAPFAAVIAIGCGSQYWNDEVTPSGSTSEARS